MEKNFEYNTNIKERTRQNYIWIKKCNTLYEKLKEIFDFKSMELQDGKSEPVKLFL